MVNSGCRWDIYARWAAKSSAFVLLLRGNRATLA